MAVNALIEKGWRIVVAAGNSNDDACKYSPASSNAIIVGSFNNKGILSDFSNYGKCVSVLAPGEQVLSTYPGNSAAYASGTSFAAPLVAGIMSTNNWDKE
jgi:cerevisin